MCKLTEEGLSNVRTADPLVCTYGFLDFKCSIKEDIENIEGCGICSACLDRLCSPLCPEGRFDSKFAMVFRNPLSVDTPYTGYMRADCDFGQVFQLYLKILGIAKTELYMTGALFCPVPDDRIPTIEENRLCGCVYKEKEISRLNNVRIIFLMGEDALKQFIDPKLNIRDHWSDTYYIASDPSVYLLPIFHVGTYLNNVEEQRNILKHLLILRKRFVEPVKRGEL